MELLRAPLLIAALMAQISIASLYYAWAASYLWAWFVVPALNAPPLSVLQIFGITLTLSMLRPRVTFNNNDSSDWASDLAVLILSPLLALGLGYAIKFLWM